MPLIRPADADRVPRRALVLDLGDLRRHGEEVVARARAEAAAIIEEARAERARLVQGGREEGFAEGRAAGEAQGLEEGRAEGRRRALTEMSARLGALDAAWSAALAKFEAERAEVLAAARESVIVLAAEIASRVTKRTIELDPAVVRDQLEAALGLTLRATRLVIRVNPEDRAIAAQALPELLKTLAGAAHAELAEDASLDRGSCVIRTDHGEVDASIGTQLDRMAGALLPDRLQGDGGRGGGTS